MKSGYKLVEKPATLQRWCQINLVGALRKPPNSTAAGDAANTSTVILPFCG